MLSRNLAKRLLDCANSSQSISYTGPFSSFPNCLMNEARYKCPKLQTPHPGNPCSPQGFVQITGLKYQELLILLYRSIKTTPGSALVQAERVIVSHKSRAFIVL